jgi:hypothetical protein
MTGGQEMALGCRAMANLRIALIMVCAAFLAAGCGASVPSAQTSPSSSPAAPRTPSASAHVVARDSLKCHARAVRRRPRDHTRVGIRVRTRPHAWIAATADWSPFSDVRAAGRASGHGSRTLRLRVSHAAAGVRVAIEVRVSWHGRRGRCQAFLRPRAALAAARTSSQPAAPPSPAQSPAPTQPPSPAPPPSPTSASCYPLTNGGNCYEPGEYCRDDDHGVSGVAGDGEKIICEDNNGWRWEPA